MPDDEITGSRVLQIFADSLTQFLSIVFENLENINPALSVSISFHIFAD